MLHNEARKLLVEGYEATHNAEAIAKIFHVNKYTVYYLEEQKQSTGSVNLQTWQRGRKALLNSADKARLAHCITKNRTISLEELRAVGIESQHFDYESSGLCIGISREKSRPFGDRTGASPMCRQNVSGGKS